VGDSTTPSSKRMKLTKLVAAPVWQAEVPPRAFRRFAAVRTASQLIPRVRRLLGVHGQAASGMVVFDRIA
jgi:hypothetical protein